MAAEILAKAARKLRLDPAELGTPLPEPKPVEGPAQDVERVTHEAPPMARSAPAASAAPFDIEQPRPRRPPAPAEAGSNEANAPFDGERESAVARAA
jgi:hypothetical protein